MAPAPPREHHVVHGTATWPSGGCFSPPARPWPKSQKSSAAETALVPPKRGALTHGLGKVTNVVRPSIYVWEATAKARGAFMRHDAELTGVVAPYVVAHCFREGAIEYDVGEALAKYTSRGRFRWLDFCEDLEAEARRFSQRKAPVESMPVSRVPALLRSSTTESLLLPRVASRPRLEAALGRSPSGFGLSHSPSRLGLGRSPSASSLTGLGSMHSLRSGASGATRLRAPTEARARRLAAISSGASDVARQYKRGARIDEQSAARLDARARLLATRAAEGVDESEGEDEGASEAAGSERGLATFHAHRGAVRVSATPPPSVCGSDAGAAADGQSSLANPARDGRFRQRSETHLVAEEIMASRFSNARKAFQFIDVDNSGKIDTAELRRALDLWNIPVSDAQVAALLAACDEDGDGQIDYKEFVDALVRDTVAPDAMGKRGMHALEAMGAPDLDPSHLGHRRKDQKEAQFEISINAQPRADEPLRDAPWQSPPLRAQAPPKPAPKPAPPKEADARFERRGETHEAAVDAIANRFSNARKAFQFIDVDNSGKIDAAELRRALDRWNIPVSDAQVAALLATCDANADGQIDYNEFVDALVRDTVAPDAMGKRGMHALEAMGAPDLDPSHLRGARAAKNANFSINDAAGAAFVPRPRVAKAADARGAVTRIGDARVGSDGAPPKGPTPQLLTIEPPPSNASNVSRASSVASSTPSRRAPPGPGLAKPAAPDGWAKPASGKRAVKRGDKHTLVSGAKTRAQTDQLLASVTGQSYQYKDLQAAFEYVDAGGSGTLLQAEVRRALELWKVRIDEKVLSLLLAHLDKGDGKVPYTKLVEALARGA